MDSSRSAESPAQEYDSEEEPWTPSVNWTPPKYKHESQVDWEFHDRINNSDSSLIIIKKKIKYFKCWHCNVKKYESRSALNRHIVNIHCFAKCDVCDKTCLNREQLQEHIKSVHNGKKYHCTSCPAKYVRKAYLKKHEAKEHGTEVTPATPSAESN